MSDESPVTYVSYLDLDRILSAQHTAAPLALGPTVVAAEHFFIVVHQSFELWFKQVLIDLESASVALASPQTGAEAACEHLRRVAAILGLLTQHLALFDHLSPHDFLSFRPFLGSASGSESQQFRAVQRALGLHSHASSPVYDAFRHALDARRLSLAGLYAAPHQHGPLYRVAEALVDISMAFWQVEAQHVQIVERMIGQRRGTGGSSGATHLARSLEVKAFPERWAIRTQL